MDTGHAEQHAKSRTIAKAAPLFAGECLAQEMYAAPCGPLPNATHTLNHTKSNGAQEIWIPGIYLTALGNWAARSTLAMRAQVSKMAMRRHQKQIGKLQSRRLIRATVIILI